MAGPPTAPPATYPAPHRLDLQPQARELLEVASPALGAVVGHKNQLLAQAAQHFERLRHALNHAVAAPDDAVAVKDEAVHAVNQSALVLERGPASCRRWGVRQPWSAHVRGQGAGHRCRAQARREVYHRRLQTPAQGIPSPSFQVCMVRMARISPRHRQTHACPCHFLPGP